MIKYYCDRCGTECKENNLTKVRIPKEKGRFHSFSTEEISVCKDCNDEYEKVIDALTDIRFLMFEKFYPPIVMELKKKYTGDATDTNVGGKVEGKNV